MNSLKLRAKYRWARLTPGAQIAHIRTRISVLSQTLDFLFAITLVVVSSLRIVHCLSPSGAQPPAVSVLHILDDEELESTSGHRTSFMG
jgi:hypothetical protein